MQDGFDSFSGARTFGRRASARPVETPPIRMAAPGHEAQYEIAGTVMQTLTIQLDYGESVYSQTHQMAWMSDGITMETQAGSLFGGLKRMVSGGTFFVTHYTAEQPGEVAFAPRFPGTILPFELGAGKSLVCRKETFLCAQPTVTVDVALQQRLGAGFFAGEGFILQRVTGPGTVWLDLSGEVVVKELRPGERLKVHAGHIGIQEPSVTTDIQLVRGMRNVLFGGEGLFLATLSGPGKVWLQSMPVLNLAEEIARYLPGHPPSVNESIETGVGRLVGGGATGAIVGGLLGGLLSNE
jgi:uncharacterized protein (TIGR00266 family)